MTAPSETLQDTPQEVPRGNLAGLKKYWKNDLLSGFLVFLIALPLCLGIAAASGYPPIAGVFTAIIGGILTTLLSNSELTIKGPAAGLIVIALGCVTEFGSLYGSARAYQLALGVGLAAGLIQIVLGLLRTGTLGDFFPTSAVHGMLAAIGVIIIVKQLPVAAGVGNQGEPLELLLEIPHKLAHLNPEIALIGGVSLLILFGLPLFRHPYVKRIPTPMVVVLVAVPLGLYFDLSHEHTYTFGGENYRVGEDYLVPVPDNLFAAMTLPDLSGLTTLAGWKWVLMFTLIGSLESLLSAKAIDSIDPYRRKTDLNRDLVAVGVANTVSACVGGLPMISEIVRSKANIDNGARTRFANLYHGLFLLGFVAAVPWLIHRIPLAALGAMLVYTGFRLASPREFARVYKIGTEQFLVFVTTVLAVLATDLLIGIAIGIAVEFLLALFHYPPVRSLFVPNVTVEQADGKTYLVRVRHAAIFCNWISLRGRVEQLDHGMDVVIDLSEAHLVDHTVMEKLHEMGKEFQEKNRRLVIAGLDQHHKFSNHPHAGRRLDARSAAGSRTSEDRGPRKIEDRGSRIEEIR
jgi:MFS superfamily sulfate permease-like transporter